MTRVFDKEYIGDFFSKIYDNNTNDTTSAFSFAHIVKGINTPVESLNKQI
jgi:hypothetical protein